jgi:hypothetical protein
VSDLDLPIPGSRWESGASRGFVSYFIAPPFFSSSWKYKDNTNYQHKKSIGVFMLLILNGA